MEIINALGINWQLLVAQIVNFGVILAVLTYLVYKPVLKVIDERREATRKAMEDVDIAERQRKETEVFRQDQLKKIDEEVGAFLARAKQDAERTRQEILDSAKREAEQIMERGKRALEQERSEALREVQASVTKVIVSLTEKILRREFTPADQKRIVADLTASVSADLKA